MQMTLHVSGRYSFTSDNATLLGMKEIFKARAVFLQYFPKSAVSCYPEHMIRAQNTAERGLGNLPEMPLWALPSCFRRLERWVVSGAL